MLSTISWACGMAYHVFYYLCLSLMGILNFAVPYTHQWWISELSTYIDAHTHTFQDNILFMYNVSISSATEFVGPSKRHIVGCLPNFSWCLGCLIIEGNAVGIRNHIHLQILNTILVACTLPILWLVSLPNTTLFFGRVCLSKVYHSTKMYNLGNPRLQQYEGSITVMLSFKNRAL